MSSLNVQATNYSLTSQRQSLLSEITGLRIDGRKPDELRRIICRLNIMRDCEGSAYVEQGMTKVIATVKGPREIHGEKLRAMHTHAVIHCEYSMAVFATSERRKRPNGDKKSIEFAAHLEKVLSSIVKVELFPWSEIDVFVEILQADGSNFPAAINAATLALVDAGIPLKEYVCASTVSITKTGVPLIDVSYGEEMLGCPILTVVIQSLSEKIVFVEMSQRFHISLLNDTLQQGILACKKIKSVMDRAVQSHLQKTFNAMDYNIMIEGTD